MATDLNITLDDLSVMIGIPAGRDLPGHTVRSLWATQAKMQARNIDCALGMIIGSSVVTWARDEVIATFLESKCNRLFWIDSDMVWEPEQFLRLLAISKLPEYQIVAATYPAKQDGPPTFFLNYDAARGKLQPNPWGLVEIDGVGLGFCVMTREAVERLVERAPKLIDDVSKREIAAVFRIDSTEGRRRGEDIGFFHDLRALGYKVWLDTTVDLGHIGTKTYRGSIRNTL